MKKSPLPHPWNHESGDLNHSVGFDYSKVEGGIAEKDWDSIQTASEGLEKLLRWIWQSGSFKTSFIKFVAMSAMMRPDLLDDESYEQLSKKLGCTRSMISFNAVQFQNEFGVHFRRSKENGQCEIYRAARLKSHLMSGKGRFLVKAK